MAKIGSAKTGLTASALQYTDIPLQLFTLGARLGPFLFVASVPLFVALAHPLFLFGTRGLAQQNARQVTRLSDTRKWYHGRKIPSVRARKQHTSKGVKANYGVRQRDSCYS